MNDAKYLGEAISKCVTFASLNLNLNYNSIDDNGAKYLGEAISKWGTLTSLKLLLYSNSISYYGKRILKYLVMKSKRLIVFYNWEN